MRVLSGQLGGRRRPTIEDVAARAGVSRQTVSRAINAKGEIHPDTRTRVLAAIDELGYRPNRLAQGMVTRRTRTVGLVAGDIRNPFFGEVAHGASTELGAHDHKLVVMDTYEDAERELAALTELSHDVDGIIAFLYHSELAELEAVATTVPSLVVLNRDVPLPGARVLTIDLVTGGRLAAEHLIARGHRRLAVVVNATQAAGTGRRVGGFLVAAAEAGIEDVVQLPALPSMPGGSEVGAELVRSHPEVTGVFAYNDLVAAGLIGSVRRAGWMIPDDLAVVGCDDIAIASAWDPPLTTVRIGAEHVGTVAAKHALELLGVGEPAPSGDVFGVELVVRASS